MVTIFGLREKKSFELVHEPSNGCGLEFKLSLKFSGIHQEEFSRDEESPRELEAKVIEEGEKARAAAHGNHG